MASPHSKGHYVGGGKTRKPKVSYKTRGAARNALVRRLIRDWLEMNTYPCTGGGGEGSGADLHFHFGHSTPKQRWSTWKREVSKRIRFLVTGKA